MPNKLNDNLSLQEISKTLSNVDRVLTERLEADTNMLVTLADEMAERATTFGGHGYKSFLEARENFIATIHKIKCEHKEFMCVLKCK